MSEPPSGAELLAKLTAIRREHPEAIAEALQGRRRRFSLLSESGTIFLIAADHPARGSLKAGDDPMAMADRGDLLRRLLIALERPSVDGLVGAPDLVEDLALLGALEDKVVFGCMNRGGLAGSAFELDDRFTAYTADQIAADQLDGGKMMVRIADEDPSTLRTLCAASEAINGLAALKKPAMVGVWASRLSGGRAVNVERPDSLIRAVQIASGLGRTSAYTWLNLPVIRGMERIFAATSLPVTLIGGDPGTAAPEVYRRWAEVTAQPQVVGLVVGRTVLYPYHGDVRRAVDEAAAVIAGRAKAA
ncbi:MAG: deoxyribose-phosphate aldolase [Candidatus Dormibacteraeota bacterium]|nr:deoxyribose-phosphate aldolase [Candidatus Dormibacteraeota bacterium]